MPNITVSIKPAGSAYAININETPASAAIKAHKAAGGFFVIDKNVAETYAGIMPCERAYIFQASEANKNLESVEKMLIWLKDSGALRDGRLMAVGGGITGDTAGFAAAVYMRGIKLIQMPTTLLAMVDSSVGGKTGVNLKGIKNNIGAFYQPMEVVIDTSFLKSLSESEILNGLAESIKISCVYGSDLFYFIAENKDHILNREEWAMVKLVETSCSLKAKIVERDEREGGLRKLLNFGHTVAHAIEADSDYAVRHGYAVAIGMVYESLFALENGYTDIETFDTIKNVAKSFGYPITYVPRSKKVFLSALQKDKKAVHTGVSLALAGPGMMGKIVDEINPADICETVFKNPEL